MIEKYLVQLVAKNFIFKCYFIAVFGIFIIYDAICISILKLRTKK